MPQFRRILVPMKLGIIGEEMVATAVKLASEHGATVEALYVIRVPLDLPLDAEMLEEEARAEASLAEAARSARSTASRSTGTICARARSAARSSNARASATPT